MKKVYGYMLAMLPSLFIFNFGKAQQPVKISAPDSTVITYSSTDSRAFALTGLTTYYANKNWPGSPSDSGCIYWGVNDTLFSVINGNNTSAPESGTCNGMSNLILTTNPSYTNLSTGQACFFGSTVIYDAMYNTIYSFNVYQYIIARKKNGEVMPFDLVDGKVLARVPSSDFYISTSLYLVYPSGSLWYYPGTDGYTFYMGNNIMNYALNNFNKMHTDYNRSMCTSWSGGDFYRIAYNATFQTTEPSCYGMATGIINSNVSGGVAPYDFSWNTSNPSSEDQVGIEAGNYTVNIGDAAHCIITRDITINQPDSLKANLSVSQIPCAGQANGSVLVAPSGGKGSLVITWYNGNTGASLANLSPGKYSVQIKDENNCKTSDTATITEPEALDYSLVLINPTCYGKMDGSISVNPSGGTTPYHFEWTSGDTLNTRTGLGNGNYSLTLSDNHTCVQQIQTSLVAPDSLRIIPDITGVSCFGLSDGSIHLDVSGGTQPYVINWSNGTSGLNNPGLSKGDYTATITDNHNCIVENVLTVSQPDTLTISIQKSDITCAGDANGSIIATTTGGTLPYSYTWNNNETTASVAGLDAGSYSVVVKDKNNCEAGGGTSILEPPALDFLLSPTSPVCSYGTDGEISVDATGGTLPYHYLWSRGDTSEILEMAKTGTYTFTLKDKNGCSKETEIVLNALSNLKVEKAITQVSCNGLQDGAATLSISGGLEPYDLLWSGGSSSTTRNGLGGGNYPFRVLDNYLCVVRDTVQLIEPAELVATPSPMDPSCFQGSNGMINLAVSGGTEPYTFLWNTNDENPAISGLSAGSYNVTVKDAHECTDVASTVLTDPPPDVAGFNYLADNGQVTFNNFSTPGTYAWDFGDEQGSQDANPVHMYKSNGTYNVCLTLITSCSTMQSCQEVKIDGITIVPKSGSAISIYPNPAGEKVTVSWEGRGQPSGIFILDALGREVLSKNVSKADLEQLDISHLVNGLYRVKLVFANYSESLPLIINH